MSVIGRQNRILEHELHEAMRVSARTASHELVNRGPSLGSTTPMGLSGAISNPNEQNLTVARRLDRACMKSVSASDKLRQNRRNTRCCVDFRAIVCSVRNVSRTRMHHRLTRTASTGRGYMRGASLFV